MNKVERKSWTREELILAINLYCKTPFGKIHIKNPDIINLARKLGRSSGSVSYKLANFANLDPSLDRKGASHTSKLDREVWNEFFENWDAMIFESERKMAVLKGENPEFDFNDSFEGKTRDVIVKSRINQNFFRQMILATYNSTCCITGIFVPELLVASHIIPWSVDEKNRLNPGNGLCLNVLHDKAFDKGFITISENFRIVVSPELRMSDDIYKKHSMLTGYADQKITLPTRFLPDQNFLEFHRNHIFRR